MKITDLIIKKSCSPAIYKRGMEYFKEGRVHLRKREENHISAIVDGERVYNVSVKLDDNGIKDSLCTCPYFETMNCTCKHIVAVLKQRQTEIEEGESYVNENDKIAQRLCDSFASRLQPQNILHIKFHLYITQPSLDTTYFSIAMEFGHNKGVMQGIEAFLESYSKKQPYQINKQLSYIPEITHFTSPQKEILDILAESYENRSNSDIFNNRISYQTSFGQATAMRIFSLLENADFTLTYNGVTISDIRIAEGDPDIIIDINAVDGGISLSVNDKGYSLATDGSFFLYDGIIYKTTKKWRDYFMPVYNALASQGRTQISFEGANMLPFATYVLPQLRGRHNVITEGIDELIVAEKPVFEIYFDARESFVTAVIIAKYGTVSQRLPLDTSKQEERIVVRDTEEESRILSFFSDFDYENNGYILKDDEKIYKFFRYTLPQLQKLAKIVTSDSFEKINSPVSDYISTSVDYKKSLNLLQADFETTLSHEEIIGILAAIKLKKSFYRLKDNRFIQLEDNENQSIFSLLDRLGFSENDISQKSKEIPTYHALYLNSLSFVEKNSSFIEYIDEIQKTAPVFSKELDKVLRSYQKDGVKWLKQLSYLGFGGILADDMGLGKTLQVLAYISSEKPEKPALIVTPSTLTYNWYSEIKKFTPKLKTLIVNGTKPERNQLINTINDYDVIITSYPLLRRDIQKYAPQEFSYCFIDEAQYIKNPKTKNALSVKKINAEHKFALTGTPIENSLSELWSIFDFVMPGYLKGLEEFRQSYMNDNTASLLDLKAIVKPFILRRMKHEVLEELPEKIEHTLFAELTPEQKNMYSAFLSLARDETISILEDKSSNKIQIFTLLTRLRQICCHPSLFDENYTSESGKLELLLEITENSIESGHRLLIFSQYTSMLSIIRENLEKRHIRSFYLDGKTPSYERLEMADRFNYGERDVFLISLKAGGTGLNLTGADTVIHYDPWWNPAVMDQASDRAYRIGQTKAVQVMKLVSKGTIEEKIINLQESKRNLANDIIQINHDTLSSLTKEEILSLFE